LCRVKIVVAWVAIAFLGYPCGIGFRCLYWLLFGGHVCKVFIKWIFG
jgi:hypothetical protein